MTTKVQMSRFTSPNPSTSKLKIARIKLTNNPQPTILFYFLVLTSRIDPSKRAPPTKEERRKNIRDTRIETDTTFECSNGDRDR